jgi:Protein of unknown function (DUF1045)
LPEPYRAALYYAPEPNDPLWQRGCAWLGRDPESGLALPQPNISGIAALTSDPRRYGFHATLKPPMRLTDTLEHFLADVESLAARTKVFALPPLAVTLIGKFIALCPAAPSPELHNLADACIMELDAHRLPEDAATRAKRAAGRTDSQRRNLERWGYPLVLEDWLFHMTLSNSIAHNPLTSEAEHFFADILHLPRNVESLSVFIEPDLGSSFQLLKRFKLRP